MNQSPKKSTPKVNRVLYVLTVTMLFVIAVVIAITSASSRAKKPENNPADESSSVVTSVHTPESTAPVTTDRTANTTTAAPQTSAAPQIQDSADDTNEPAPVSEPLPMFKLPVNGILSKGHDTSVQVYSTTMNDYRVHCGIDVVTSEKAPVYASADGTVAQVWEDPLMGYCIAINHSGGSVTVYKNLAEDFAVGIEEGAAVAVGQLLGTVGGTAMIEVAEEPHLHFEMTVDGNSVDPLEYFDETALVSLTMDSGYES